MKIELQKAIIGKPLDFISSIKREMDENLKEIIEDRVDTIFNENSTDYEGRVLASMRNFLNTEDEIFHFSTNNSDRKIDLARDEVSDILNYYEELEMSRKLRFSNALDGNETSFYRAYNEVFGVDEE